MRRPPALVVLALVVACSGATESTTTPAAEDGAASATEAVERLQDFLEAGDFEGAGTVTVPEQAILATLAEGASPSQIADALEDPDSEVVANFWSGFAQGAGDLFSGELTVEESGSATERGVEFTLVGVTPEGGQEKLLVTREADGHRLDLFASFGAALAEAMVPPTELLIGSSSEDAGVILGELQDVVPSLLVAASDPSLPPGAVQRILQLVEVITRVG